MVLVIALAGCASDPVRKVQEFFQPTKAQQTLSVGLKQYEDGDYAEAARNLQGAIDLGLTDGEQANAHKHLAFIHCASGRDRACREEFRKALSISPQLELTPAEAGHPAWGPVFSSLKASPAPFKLAPPGEDGGGGGGGGGVCGAPRPLGWKPLAPCDGGGGDGDE